MQKPRLVRWKTIYSERKRGEGGGGHLGVRCLSVMSKALLYKWSWHFANEKEALWKQVISQKYGEDEGGWLSHKVRDRYGVGLWKALINKCDFFNKLSFLVGNGQRVRFWRDK